MQFKSHLDFFCLQNVQRLLNHNCKICNLCGRQLLYGFNKQVLLFLEMSFRKERGPGVQTIALFC